jgi:hypothetical protein
MKSEVRTALALLAILVVAALLNTYFLPLVGRHARPEHLAAPLVFAAFVSWRLLRREPVIRLDAFSALAVAWVLVNGISSWLYAPQPAESFVHVVRMGLLAATFLTVANLPFRDGAAWIRGFRLWLGLGLLELAYGLVSWPLAQYGNVWLPGTLQDTIIAGISIQGTQLERNLFGILAGTLLAVASYSLLAQRLRHRPVVTSNGLLIIACALAGCAVVLALTRSAWIAVVSVGPLAYVLFDRNRLSEADRPLVQATFALPVLLGVLIVMLRILPAPDSLSADSIHATAASQPDARTSAHGQAAPGHVVAGRLSTLGRLESDVTTNTRLQDARWALNDWLASPVLGHGTGSFVQLHGIRVGTAAWISNLILHTLVDTGLVGLVIQLSLFVLVASRAWRAATITRDPALAVGLKALTLGWLVMVIAYQLTDGTWLAVFWIHLGLMVNGIYCVRAEPLRRASLP